MHSHIHAKSLLFFFVFDFVMACYTQKVHIQSHRNADKWQQTSKLRREREKKPAQAKSLIELILNKVAAEKQKVENKREEKRTKKTYTKK